MERTAAQDLAGLFHHKEVAHVLTEFRACARQKRAIRRVLLYQRVDGIDV